MLLEVGDDLADTGAIAMLNINARAKPVAYLRKSTIFPNPNNRTQMQRFIPAQFHVMTMPSLQALYNR
jgi:hypothetical protein